MPPYGQYSAFGEALHFFVPPLDPLHVHIDVPYGAILLKPPDVPGRTVFIAQVTDQGSERGRPRAAGIVRPDGGVTVVGSGKTGEAASG